MSYEWCNQFLRKGATSSRAEKGATFCGLQPLNRLVCANKKLQRLKPSSTAKLYGTSKLVPLRNKAIVVGAEAAGAATLLNFRFEISDSRTRETVCGNESKQEALAWRERGHDKARICANRGPGGAAAAKNSGFKNPDFRMKRPFIGS